MHRCIVILNLTINGLIHDDTDNAYFQNYPNAAATRTKINPVQMADHRHVALTKPIGSKSVVWECFGIPVLLRGNGLRSTDKTKVYCFVLNLINVKYSFTSIY